MANTNTITEIKNSSREKFDDEIELRRLARSVSLAEKYFLFFASCNQLPKQKELIKKLKDELEGKKIAVIEFKEPIKNLLSELRKRLKTKNPDAVIVTGLRYSLSNEAKAKDTPFIANLNISRDSFKDFLACPLILFLPEFAIAKLMNGAPDFFSVRSGIFFFETDETLMSREISQAISLDYQDHDTLNYLERQQRIANLQELLAEYQSLPENKRDAETEYQLKDKLASLYFKTANYAKAEKLRIELLPLAKGKNDKKYAAQLNNLGLVYSSQGDYRKAEVNHLKALQIRLNILGENHPATASSYNNLGNVYYLQGDNSKAEEYHLNALQIKLNSVGENHPDTARSYNNLGLVYYSQGDNSKAEEYYLKALQIKLNILGENHPDTARSYNNLGMVYDSLGDYTKAEEYYLKALQIQLNILGENHPNRASSYNNLGVVYENQNKLTEAEEYYQKALKIWSAFFPENHPEIQRAKRNLERVREKLGK